MSKSGADLLGPRRTVWGEILWNSFRRQFQTIWLLVHQIQLGTRWIGDRWDFVECLPYIFDSVGVTEW